MPQDNLLRKYNLGIITQQELLEGLAISVLDGDSPAAIALLPENFRLLLKEYVLAYPTTDEGWAKLRNIGSSPPAEGSCRLHRRGIEVLREHFLREAGGT